MPRESDEFFVVGGPVQPDRACYVPRAADDELLGAIAAQRFAYVLSPRATGKSSLIGRTIRRLRNDGQLGAVVDLTQIGARNESADAGRWYYSIAYRIVRELRLKVDLQAWWHEKSVLLSEQRLVEFFWEIVLTNTAAPVTIFIDEAERVADLPFTTELFAVIHSCYARRVSEPDYTRLNFVVLGVATPEQLSSDDRVSPFVDGKAIELRDFTPEESYRLWRGFGDDEEIARGLIDRIHPWTGGHPYLTQKLGRGVARKGRRLADVEQVAHELFLAPGVSQEEPLLNHIRLALSAPTPRMRQALGLLRRLAKGMEVHRDVDSAPIQVLQLAGVVSIDGNGRLRYRNRIFAEVFDARWASSSAPANWRLPATIAAGVALMLLVPFWYFRVLPGPYVNTLSVVSQDYAVAEDAYNRLRALPFFAGTADRLFAEAMVRRSQLTVTMAEALAADAALRRLPDREALADEMLAQFWLRQSSAAARRGDRDAALVYAMEARDGQPDQVRALAAELISSDYRQLEQSFRLSQAPLAWQVDWEAAVLTTVDQAHRVRHFPLRSGGSGGASNVLTPVPGRLTAIQHVPVVRRIEVDEQGTSGAFNLLLSIQHTRASDLLLKLTAPSGAEAELAVPQPRADQQEFIFNARRDLGLAALADEPIEGQWELTVVDRRAGEAGSLVHWGLQFAGAARGWDDEPEQGVPLPDPGLTEQIDVELSRDGRLALAVPTRLSAAGAVSVWDLRGGVRLRDLPVQSTPQSAILTHNPSRALILTAEELAIWDVNDGRALVRVPFAASSGLAPALSPDERFVVVSEGDESTPTVSLFSVADGERVAQFPGWPGASAWALADDAAYLAILDGSRRGRLLDPRTGRMLSEFVHQRNLVRIVPVVREDLLVTVDVDGAVIAWRAEQPALRVSATDSYYLGRTLDAGTLDVARDAPTIAFDTAGRLIAMRGLGGRDAAKFLGTSGSAEQTSIRIDPEARYVVSATGPLLRFWRIEPSTHVGPSAFDLSAVDLDATGRYAALGFHDGHVRIKSAAELELAEPASQTVDYIGHRGMVTRVALNSEHGVFATGGEDGVVRLWDLQTVAPREFFLRHPMGPVTALAISSDAQWVVSAADTSARIWQLGTGRRVDEIPVNGTALAVAFAPRADIVAVGDSAGNIFYGAWSEPLRSSRARGAVTALAFTHDSQVMASGDAMGNLLLWDVVTGEPSRGTHSFAQPVEWIHFEPGEESLLAVAGQWIHRLEIGATGLTLSASRMLPTEFGADAALTQLEDGSIRAIGSPSSGSLAPRDFLMTESTHDPLPADSPELARPWREILCLDVDRTTGAVRVSCQ